MQNDPVLARIVLPAGNSYSRTGKPIPFYVHGGLHMMAGNSEPYFSLTYDCGDSGGAGHDAIAEHFGDRFADLAALHLSSIDGVPMHAGANGMYWLAPALDDNALGEQYHGCNSKLNLPKPAGAPRRGDWDTTDYRSPTPAESLAIFARQWRMSDEETAALVDEGKALIRQTHDDRRAVVRKWLADKAEQRAPIWRSQAVACIVNHSLVIYGAPYNPAKMVS